MFGSLSTRFPQKQTATRAPVTQAEIYFTAVSPPQCAPKRVILALLLHMHTCRHAWIYLVAGKVIPKTAPMCVCALRKSVIVKAVLLPAAHRANAGAVSSDSKLSQQQTGGSGLGKAACRNKPDTHHNPPPKKKKKNIHINWRSQHCCASKPSQWANEDVHTRQPFSGNTRATVVTFGAPHSTSLS